MKLWREHYAPIRIGLDGDAKKLNVVATKSEDGKTFYVKAVNPTEEVCQVTLNVVAAKSASMQIVAGERLNNRNTLANPNAIAPKEHEVKLDGKTVQFELPAYSAGVVTVK
jgi:alpha-L-arabinofuranosidase